ncbi:alpha-ketoacid dehydrogenase subunit beta [Staphylococcus aureus]|nr:alpha-ketoacid dehydrogenase subunit beta [Staphylococcus aureus]
MAKLSYLEAIRQAQDLALQQNKDVFILGEDVGKKGGVFGTTQGLQQQYGEDRVIDTPLAESNIVGTAIGAAMVGKRPIAEIQFADFILPATNQIISEAAKMRYRSNNDWQCPLTIRAPFGGGVHGGLYHSQSIESIFASSPGLTIVIPSTPYDAKGLLLSSIESNDPVLYFEHKKAYRFLKEEVPEEYYTVPLGKADVKREGEDLTVFCYGLMVNYCLQAADILAADGIFASSPGLTIVIPSTPYDAKGLLLSSIESNDPVLYFEHKKAYRFLKEEVPEEYYTVPLGKADVKREGEDLTVFCYGLMVNYCLQAADILAADGINVEVVDLRTVYPLDKETIIDRAKHTGKVLLVTEDNLEGSIMSEVSAIIAEHCLFDLDAPIMRLAAPDIPSMPFSPVLENEIMMNPEKILNKMRELAEF